MSDYDSDEVVKDKQSPNIEFEKRMRFLRILDERNRVSGTSEDPFNMQQNENIGEVFDEAYQYQHPPPNLFENADEQPVGGEVFEEFPEIDKPNPDPFTPDGRKARNDTTHAPKPYQEPPAQKVDWSKAKVPSNLLIKGRSIRTQGRSADSHKQKQKQLHLVDRPEKQQTDFAPDSDLFPQRYVDTLQEQLSSYIYSTEQRNKHQQHAMEKMNNIVEYIVKLCHRVFHHTPPTTSADYKLYCVYRADRVKDITKFRRAQYEHLRRRVVHEDPWSSIRPKE
ncbi:hypothetical protein EDC96DRAFT_591030 [Choanephora cucurbitarum]|nr:hypothetical protein EDC96DRAFT_591030 [Choanephora cucurbitarum]